MRKHLTFANAVALLALFVALGGTSYAVSKLNGKDIVDGSVTGSKLAKDTLTGKQIKEKKLGTVPLSADTEHLLLSAQAGGKGKKSGGSQRAAAATSGDVVVRLSIGETAPLLSSGPFTYRAKCDSGPNGPLPRVLIETTEAHSTTEMGQLEPGAPQQAGAQDDSYPPGFITEGIGKFAVAPSGASINVGSLYYGAGLLGADCIYAAFGIA
jgi:hypothetical protein